MPANKLVVITLLTSYLGTVLALNGGTLESSFAAEGGDVLGSPVAADVDGDGVMEIICGTGASGGPSGLYVYELNGTQASGFPFAVNNQGIRVSPTLYDVDGDGRPEILFTTSSSVYTDPASVYAVNGENGTAAWQFIVNRVNYGAPDGGFMTTVGNYYYDWDYHSYLPERSFLTSEVAPIVPADMDGDGVVELITTWKIRPINAAGQSGDNHQDHSPLVNDTFGGAEAGTVGESWSGGSLSLTLNGTRDWLYHMHQLIEAGTAVGNVGRSVNTPFFLADNDSVVCYDITGSSANFCNEMLHGQFGVNKRMMSGTYGAGVDVNVADIDGDGKDEVLCPTPFYSTLWQPHLTVLDDDGSILWREWGSEFTATGWDGTVWPASSAMIPCNPDGDNRIDVLVSKGGPELSRYTWNGAELVQQWSISFGSYICSQPVVGDVDGDGEQEVVVGVCDPTDRSAIVSNALTVITWDGAIQDTMSLTNGVKQTPQLIDADADGELEVLARTWGQRSSDGCRIVVASFGPGDTNAVDWAAHYKSPVRYGWLNQSIYPEGTPLVTNVAEGARSVKFDWTIPSPAPASFSILRADNVDSAYTMLCTLPSTAVHYWDTDLNAGELYAYQVVANFAGHSVTSAPFTALVLANNNLLQNSGFEENGERGWDKWYTGSLSWNEMIQLNGGYQGRYSMQILYDNSTDDSSIKQFNNYGIPDAYVPVTPGGTTLYSYGCWMRAGAMNSTSRHRLEIGTGLNGENQTYSGVSADYPNYYTPEFVVPAGSAQTEWTYVNRVTVLREAVASLDLRHRTYSTGLTGSMQLDNIFFREVNEDLPVIFDFESDWRYSDTGVAPPSDWYTTDFDDSSWPSGTAPFAAGSGPSGHTSIQQYHDTYWFRREMVLQEPPGEMMLYGVSLDRFELWVNGVKVPAQSIYETQPQSNLIRGFDLTPLTDMFVVGTNTLAVEMSNEHPYTNWDDIQFAMAIEAGPAAEGQTENGIPHAWLEAYGLSTNNSIESVHSDADAFNNLEEWIADSNPTDSTLFFGPLSITVDTSDTGLLELPYTSPARYYRLHHTPDLIETNWSEINANSGTGAQLIWSVETTNAPAGFYKASVEIP